MDEAIANYDRVIELSPKYAPAYYSRGLIKERQGKYEEALADYDKAIDLNPKISKRKRTQQ